MTQKQDDTDLSSDELASRFSMLELISKLIGDVSDLIFKETELIRSEVNDKITQLQAGVGKMAAGAVVLLVALMVLADALVMAVAVLLGTAQASGDKTGLASVIVGGLFAAVGAFLVRSGAGDIKPMNLKPDRTAMQVRRDRDLARDQMR
ncbi:MAG: hypothetical protein AcusKO_25600 [Acuticoccus sp.]